MARARLEMKIPIGTPIDQAIRDAIDCAKDNESLVEFHFNDVLVRVAEDSDPKLIYRDWNRAMRGYTEKNEVGPYPPAKLTEEEKASDACIEAEKEVKRQERSAERRKAGAKQSAAVSAELATVGNLELRDREGWNKAFEANRDPYGRAAIRFAERWGRLMQARIAKGQTVAECAEETSQLADTEGITGFMFSCAKNLLCEAWEHGDALQEIPT